MSPAHQVLTLFGDYWWDVEDALPTGAIIASLGDLGVREATARAAISRLTQLDLLVASREGRRTAHRLSQRAREIVADEAHWLETFGVDEAAWDGRWSVVVFSIPEARRALRHAARSRLRWLGYAPLYDGVWVSPWPADAALEQITRLGVEDVTVMRASVDAASPHDPQSAWDLSGIAERYAQFAEALAAVRTDASPALALAERTRLMLRWQTFRQLDPRLPLELLPAHWPRSFVRHLFAEVHGALADAAMARVREHVTGIDPARAALVQLRHLH